MDAYDCEITDKQISKRIDEIYNNPAKHRFYSQYEAFKANKTTGPRGGNFIGRKRKCFYCGRKQEGHAEQDEKL